jgi:hypothetical protein
VFSLEKKMVASAAQHTALLLKKRTEERENEGGVVSPLHSDQRHGDAVANTSVKKSQSKSSGWGMTGLMSLGSTIGKGIGSAALSISGTAAGADATENAGTNGSGAGASEIRILPDSLAAVVTVALAASVSALVTCR